MNNQKNDIQDWNEFVLDERLKKLEKRIDGLEWAVNNYYSDFTDIDYKNTLVQIVQNLRDTVESIDIFKMLYRYRKEPGNDRLY